jgi:hypothetical protein
MRPSDRWWRAAIPPESPRPPKKPPPPPGKWKAGWRAIASDLLAAADADPPAAAPAWQMPSAPYRRHRADVAGRLHLDPATLEVIKAELRAREWDRRRSALAIDLAAADDRAGDETASDNQARA